MRAGPAIPPQRPAYQRRDPDRIYNEVVVGGIRTIGEVLRQRNAY